MVFAYIMLDKANDETVFEGYVRNIKKDINPKQDCYFFSGNKKVISFLEKVKKELQDPRLFDTFIYMIEDKVQIKNWKEKFSEKWMKLDKNFDYNIIEDMSIVKPYLPAFQFKGPRWIGQILETYITNIYNGRTGFNTFLEINDFKNRSDFSTSQYLFDIMKNNSVFYMKQLEKKAKEFKSISKDKIILEAAFRRSPSSKISILASKIALENGWNGTSNTQLFGIVDKSKIGGSMAHAFVMSFETELEAFKAWYSIFPKGTILIDTYDTLKAIDILIDNNIRPIDVRIDSGDFFDIVPKVKAKLDKAGWNEVGIFLSGDMTPELVSELIEKKIFFTKYMAGTKYVYNEEDSKKKWNRKRKL